MATLETLGELREAILASLREQYLGRVETVASNDPHADVRGQERRPLVTPALLLHLEAIEPGQEDGTDRVPLRLILALHCVLSTRTAQVGVQIHEFAADVLAYVRHQVWGYPGEVSQPEALAAQESEFVPGVMGFESWLVRWEQPVFLGAGHWAPGDTAMPAEVWFSMAPEIGAEHLADYQQIIPGE